MGSKGKARLTGEAWKPTCRNNLAKLHELLPQICRWPDKCKRKQFHRGRCVGKYYVWDSHVPGNVEHRMRKHTIGDDISFYGGKR